MSFKPGDTVVVYFNTINPSTGVLQNTDSAPTATMEHNGADDGSVTLTVTNVTTGRYKVTGTIPSSGYTSGDKIAVRVNATVNSLAGEYFPLQTILDGERVSDLASAVASDFSSLQSHGDSAWATATGFATSSQATSLLSAVNNLNNLSALANLFGPGAMVPPASGGQAYQFALTIRDSEGNLVNADSTPTVAVTNLANTSMAARLSSLTNSATGVYVFTYTVDSGDLGSSVADELSFVATCTVSSAARRADLKVSLLAAEPLTNIASILSIVQQIQFDGSNNVKAIVQAFASGQAPPSTSTIAAAILKTPNNLLATDSSGDVAANNIPATVTLADSQPNCAPATVAALATLAGSTGTLDNLPAAINGPIPTGTVLASPSPTTTTFSASGLAEDASAYIGQSVRFVAGTTAAKGLSRRIVAGSSGEAFILDTALPEPPSTGDQFEILGYLQ